jgi:hypothetical protein
MKFNTNSLGAVLTFLRDKFLKLPYVNDPAFVAKYSPWITTGLLEAANVQQLWTIWTRQTAKGQSLTGWVTVGLALVIWCNFYRVVSPEANRNALRATLIGVVINALVWLSVLFFRSTGRG